MKTFNLQVEVTLNESDELVWHVSNGKATGVGKTFYRALHDMLMQAA